MKQLYEQSITKSYTYKAYRDLVDTLITESKSTGDTQSDEILAYSKLNAQRMNRLDKTVVVTDEVKESLKNISKKYIWLVLSEGWCGDAAQILPVMNKMAEVTPFVELKIVLRDENKELMDHYLTNGGRSIPKMIILEADTMEEVSNWGPRPSGAVALVEDLKNKYGGINEELKTALQKWYNDDKGVSIQKEILELHP
ncbi:thioredoxin family protein [Myroides ceti]|uniref:Thioredoxin family protein n=1 Tax=Paenimyroides ceti TaxID=395087 RepID=A0ABT8CZR8_9FLAO|nr:thioredoxin family protein [Paenimyroides ceti]MDN3707620.1 thioredoxin family protein [Paenimyroides ceti]MDN3709724.1 thioredoxin family protein [Paenimyroides ceti]